MSYSIAFTVTGATELEAISNAVAMLRANVRLRGVNAAQRVSGMLWRVSLNVWEDV